MKIGCVLMLAVLLGSCEKDIFTEKNNDPRYIFDAYWHELDRNYSFFSYIQLNWDSVYTIYKPKVSASMSDKDLLQIFTNMTDLLQDAHTNVYAPMGIIGNINYFERYPVNQITLSDSYFSSYYMNKVFDYGKLRSNHIGYIRIKTFEGDHQDFESIDDILDSLKGTSGLIIDVRSNRGGFISSCSLVAGRFTDSTKVACRYRIRNGSDHESFTEWLNVYITPAGTRIRYTNPVVILTNRRSYSATEWFVTLMDVLPKITVVGDTTGGGSAMPLIRELPNGWILRTSNTQTQLLSGRDFQFTGLFPDIPVWINQQDAEKGVDTILKRGISVLEGT